MTQDKYLSYNFFLIIEYGLTFGQKAADCIIEESWGRKFLEDQERFIKKIIS
jgi:hypothetical protein